MNWLQDFNYEVTNSDFFHPVTPGQRYVLGASSANGALGFPTGQIHIQWVGGNDDENTGLNLVTFPNSPLTGNGGFEFVAPSGRLRIQGVGLTESVKIQIVPIV